MEETDGEQKEFATTLHMLMDFPGWHFRAAAGDNHENNTKASFDGMNQHLGLLWEITDSLMLGGFIRPFDADLEIELDESTIDRCTSTMLALLMTVPNRRHIQMKRYIIH